MNIKVKRIFKLENFVVLFLVAAAILSILEIPGFQSTEKIILVLLGFVVVEGLILKLGYFENIKQSIADNKKSLKEIERIAIPNPNAIILKPVQEIVPFRDCIKGVKEVVVFASSAKYLIEENYPIIENALNIGTSFKFILISPDNPVVASLQHNSPSRTDTQTQRTWIADSRSMLLKIAKNQTPGRLRVREFPGVPTTSFTAFDLQQESGWIQTTLYLPGQSPKQCRYFNTFAQGKSEDYRVLKDTIGYLWSTSKPVNTN